MGWASGSYLAEDIYVIIRNFIPEEVRKEVATKVYERFCEEHADDWDHDTILMQDMEN